MVTVRHPELKAVGSSPDMNPLGFKSLLPLLIKVLGPIIPCEPKALRGMAGVSMYAARGVAVYRWHHSYIVHSQRHRRVLAHVSPPPKKKLGKRSRFDERSFIEIMVENKCEKVIQKLEKQKALITRTRTTRKPTNTS